MAIVHIDNLTPGMVLKSPVCDRSGKLLLPEEVELTEKHLLIFRAWGVLEAEIAGESEADEGALQVTEEIDPELIAAAEAALMPLFMHNDPEHPAIRELLRLCIARRASHAS